MNGKITDEFMGNWLLATHDKENISFAKSCIVSSSKTPMFWGSFDKIPASNIRALFLKNQQREKEININANHFRIIRNSNLDRGPIISEGLIPKIPFI